MSDRKGTISTREARRRWSAHGLECATVDSGIGFVNGYVQLPADHVARHATYDQINRTIEVHGQLTYGPDEDGWVGFDTGHSGDHWPGADRYGYEQPPWRVWSLELLERETESLARQLADMTEIGGPTSSWDCTEDEFAALLRDAKAWRAHVAAGATA